MRRYLFDGQPGVNDIVQSCDLLEIFELIVTDEIIDHIVIYSNLYANQSIGNKEFKKTSRLCKREDITAPEIRLYLAALIYRGVLGKPKEHLYYIKNKIFETPGFRRIISHDKMVLLEKFLHFDDNEELGDSYNKAAKIQPVLEKLVKRFKLLYKLERNISIDESILLWKDCIPKKRSRFGLKAFVLSEGSIGYVWNVILYIGRDTMLSENIDSNYHATKVVLTLMKGLLHKGHCVYIRNWYTSIEICNVLNTATTADVISILRRDRNTNFTYR